MSRETDFTKSISVERKSYDLIAEGADVFAEGTRRRTILCVPLRAVLITSTSFREGPLICHSELSAEGILASSGRYRRGLNHCGLIIKVREHD